MLEGVGWRERGGDVHDSVLGMVQRQSKEILEGVGKGRVVKWGGGGGGK